MCSALPATSFVRVADSNTSYRTNHRLPTVMSLVGELEMGTGRFSLSLLRASQREDDYGKGNVVFGVHGMASPDGKGWGNE